MAFNFEYFYEISNCLESQYRKDQRDSNGNILFDRESILRVSLSRIYYTCFHYCLAKFIQYGTYKKQKNSSDHRKLISTISNDLTYSSIGKKLEHLRELRNTCDYDDIATLKGNIVNLEDEFNSAILVYSLIKHDLK